MKKSIVRKGLVVGIIILFVGLIFIPSFNAVSISNDNYLLKDEQFEGDLVDNVQLTWLGTIAFSDIILAFLGFPVYFTQAKIKNNNDVAFNFEAYITLSTGAGKILDEYHYEPPIKHQAHGTHVLLIYTLHEWQDFNYLWGHFDITIDFRVLDDGSNIEKVFHGFVFHYGTFIYDKNGEIIN